MAAPLNALELLQNYRQRDQMEAMRAQQMETTARMLPLQIEGAQMNMLAKRMAMEDDRAKKNALMDFGQTGNMNSLMAADPKTGIALRASNERNALMRDQIASRERIAQQRLNNPQQRPAPPGYRFTPNGDLEAIPGGPADLKAQADAQKKASGADDVDLALGTLRDSYDRLEKGGGITSTKNGPLANVLPSIASSGAGQAAGKLFGTENQSARNDIAMTRPALLGALMKATGMSAKQMDSNAELKLWLATATDPTLDVESNRRALANIERKYLGATKGSSPEATADRGAPAVGTVKGGYRFKGGNPADQASWEKM